MRRGGGELVFDVDRVRFSKVKIQEMDGGGNHTTMWTYLVPLNLTVKSGKMCVLYYETFTAIKITLKKIVLRK